MGDICQSCGACCAAFRVTFARTEAEEGAVPIDLTRPASAVLREMRGTGGADPRCVALDGEVGTWTACTVYAGRPIPCRDFRRSWSDGRRNPDCDRARARHGLPPLEPPPP